MNKECQNCRLVFEITKDDMSFYERIKVPPPTFCVDCRLKRRLIWRNERSLYKRNCDLCGTSIISVYHKESPFKIYCKECWWGDGWNPRDYGQEYDFTKPFFEQFKDLVRNVPRVALTGAKNVNSDYCNYSLSNKNSYLCFASHYNEDSGYLTYSNKCKFCFDCLHVGESEFSIECNYCDKLFQCAYLQYAMDCMDCILGYNIRNCNSCFGCVNLRNASYNIFNVQYSKEDYEKITKDFLKDRGSFNQALMKFAEFNINQIKVFSYQKKCVQCTGNDIEESKNVKNAFSVKHSEDSKNLFVNCIRVKSCMDINNVAQDPTEFAYEVQGVTNSSNIKFCDATWDSTFMTYCNLCFSSNNMFGCIGIRKGEYCILNKQYSKEEFNILLNKITEQMKEKFYTDSNGIIYRYGEFFPSELSPFYYNETTSQEYFPLTKEEALSKNYHWREEEEKNYSVTITSGELSKNSSFYTDSVLKEVIECEHKGDCEHQCTKAFRLIQNELNIYQKIGLTLPELCPNCRHYQRLKQRNPLKLWHRKCMKEGCSNEFETSYAPDRREIIYCERCYQQEVY